MLIFEQVPLDVLHPGVIHKLLEAFISKAKSTIDIPCQESLDEIHRLGRYLAVLWKDEWFADDRLLQRLVGFSSERTLQEERDEIDFDQISTCLNNPLLSFFHSIPFRKAIRSTQLPATTNRPNPGTHASAVLPVPCKPLIQRRMSMVLIL